MDVNDLKKLIDLMNDNDLLELEINEEGKKVRLKKMYEGAPKIVSVGAAAPAAMPAAPAAAPAPAAAASPAKEEASGETIKSPMVGTFYRTPNPESPAYVEVGDTITDDSVVCILEAMKVFNEIKAEMSGKILKILVENGEAVEYGQPLFLVEPA